MNENTLERIQEWLVRNYDKEWEPLKNFLITTVDNPGWVIIVKLPGTELESKSFTTIRIDRSETDWLHCCIKDHNFQGGCGATNLTEMLETFINWAES
ncbi:hypothetical protein PHSC3_001641 [Chlamydiales bacterium STE3]|nr:hypothetical protein PHSC3_001641 [Chlamydiales bacterium STE3]